jgi:hypothetical protein
MKTGYHIVPVDQNGNLKLDDDLKTKLQLRTGDQVEITIKKIHSKKELLIKRDNPLYELIK